MVKFFCRNQEKVQKYKEDVEKSFAKTMKKLKNTKKKINVKKNLWNDWTVLVFNSMNPLQNILKIKLLSKKNYEKQFPCNNIWKAVFTEKEKYIIHMCWKIIKNIAEI